MCFVPEVERGRDDTMGRTLSGIAFGAEIRERISRGRHVSNHDILMVTPKKHEFNPKPFRIEPGGRWRTTPIEPVSHSVVRLCFASLSTTLHYAALL
jgi:hypothetical protein